jgi:hypothetical protein
MAIWNEFDLHNALVQYAKNNAVDLSADNCWRFTNLINSTLNFADMQWTHATVIAPLEAECTTLFSAWQALYNTEVAIRQAESNQANSAQSNLKSLMNGLQGLSASDKGYAIYCRLFAWRNGANQATLDAIIDRATAVAYITGLSEWQAMTAASKNFFAKELEANAALCQVLLLVLDR